MLMQDFQLPYNVGTKTEVIEKLEELIEKGNKSFLAFRALTGHIDPDGSFEISCRGRGSSLSQFRGQVIETDQGVCLKGVIEIKPSKKILLGGVLGLNVLFGIGLFLTGDSLFMLVAPLFIIIAFLNGLIASKGSYLKVALRRVLRT